MPSVRISTLSRIHKVARLSVAGVRDDRIATIVGLSLAGLASLKQRQDYKDLVQEILAGTITRWDEEIANDVVALRQEFAVGVPLAMRTLLDAVQQKRDLKSSIEAAKELLDRDPKKVFSKNAVAAPEDGERPSLPSHILNSISKDADDAVAEVANSKKVVVN